MKGKENHPRIGIFGRCNAGKSTLLNFITGVRAAIVSPNAGTTTDPVRKSYEILGFSPVVLIDTAGTDDCSPLGPERQRRTVEVASECDLALILFRSWGKSEQTLVSLFQEMKLPMVAIQNIDGGQPLIEQADIAIDLLHGENSHQALLEKIVAKLPDFSLTRVKMFADRLHRGDNIVLVCPIDGGASSGRMILPQVQALREVLDANAMAHVVQPAGLEELMHNLATPTLVVTDSQVYKRVRSIVDPAIEVTTFSILLASAKGDYNLYLKGVEKVGSLKEGDSILISEFCSHQTSCDDIARVKIPSWIEAHTGLKLNYRYIGPGDALPEDASSYAMMLMCGGCMTTRTIVKRRIEQAESIGLPVTNFGMLIRLIGT